MIQVIPALDLFRGKVVRLKQGQYNQRTTYDKSALELAKMYESMGFKRLHLVDLEGAKEGEPRHLELLQTLQNETNLQLDYGGGLRTQQAIGLALTGGARWVTAGTYAFRRYPDFVKCVNRYTADRFILAADVRDDEIRVAGWQEASGKKWRETLAAYLKLGITRIMVTDIERDGMMKGPNVDLYSQIREAFPSIELIASGGVASATDIESLDRIGVDAVIVGKALLEGAIEVEQVKRYG
jgi:phosphoribosylformimino-5-aminoimidazole carboxamide ribotide isomerase